MGNCINRCFGALDRRQKYPRSKYTDEQDFSIENFYLDDGEPRHNEMTRLLTDRERQLLSAKQFGILVHEQNRVDAELEAKLAQEEKEIEREEAAFYEAKREAARFARLNKDKENASRNNSKAWSVNDDIAGEEDDFENFLATVKARSLATRSQANVVESPTLKETSSDAENIWQTPSGLTTDHSSDLEWEPDFVSAEL
ncbi:hypothetical protein BsWGS_20245 [Bradybaena similaris]